MIQNTSYTHEATIESTSARKVHFCTESVSIIIHKAISEIVSCAVLSKGE